MAAPAAQTRIRPVGRQLAEGFGNGIAVRGVTIQLDKDIIFFEITVKPPMMDGGEPVDQTTMWNALRRTKAPRTLFEMGPCEIECAYNPLVYSQARAIINIMCAISVYFPNGDIYTDYGWLRSFDPQPLTEGELPRATVVIEFGGEDPDECSEEAFVFADAATGVCG